MEQYLHYLSSPDLHLPLLLLIRALGRQEAKVLVRCLLDRLDQET